MQPSDVAGLVEVLERAVVLMDATVRFMDENPIAAEYTVVYDDAECDGGCLRDDCLTALDDARAILAKRGRK